MLQATATRSQAEETLALAQSGDHAAFGDLVRTHQSMVFGLACHIVRDRAAAEDLAQEVFLELYRGLARLESPAHVTFWLRRVTSHRGIDRRRRAEHRTELPIDTAPEPAVLPAPRDPLLEARLRACVAELPARARAVMALRYQEDLETAEIALILGMPVNTVKSHVRRSVAWLRARLAPNKEPR
jgi:RNA polymerase sigma-70 factor (ECF subfamily)